PLRDRSRCRPLREMPTDRDIPKSHCGIWLGRQDSNLRMPVPKTGALPLGDAPAAAACAGEGGLIAAIAREGRGHAPIRHSSNERLRPPSGAVTIGLWLRWGNWT